MKKLKFNTIISRPKNHFFFLLCNSAYAHTKSIEFSKLPKVHVTFLVLVSMMKIESLDGEAMRFENKSEIWKIMAQVLLLESFLC